MVCFPCYSDLISPLDSSLNLPITSLSLHSRTLAARFIRIYPKGVSAGSSQACMRAGLLATCYATTQAFTSGHSVFRGYPLYDAKSTDLGPGRDLLVKVGSPSSGTETDCRGSALCTKLNQAGTKQYMTVPSVSFESFTGFSFGVWYRDDSSSDADAAIFDWSDSSGGDNIRAIRSSSTSVGRPAQFLPMLARNFAGRADDCQFCVCTYVITRLVCLTLSLVPCFSC